MTLTPLPRPRPDGTDVAAQLEIVVPVYNEAQQLAASITSLRFFLDSSFPLATVVTIADNASTDDTWSIASGLASSLPGVRAVHLDRKGRGRALRATWTASDAPVVAYMDVDLATGLDALLPLVAPLLTGHSDVAIGSRLAPGAHVVRGARREVISRAYNLLIRTFLGAAWTDAQCGFKAMRSDAVAAVLPLVEDDAWFFDTEVLVTSRRLGLRIHEVPVDWVDDLDSRVAVARTAWLDLCGVARMASPASRRRAARARRRRAPGRRTAQPVPEKGTHGRTDEQAGKGDQVFADELLRFAGVGVISTLAYMALFALLEPWMGSYVANATAIVACGIGNTAAHRGMAGTVRHGLDRVHRSLAASALLGVSLTFTTAALLGARTLGMDSLAPELVAVTLANLAAAALRFGILRTWVFRPRFGARVDPGAPTGDSSTTSPASMRPDPTPERASR
ncbi:MAG: glycosyltransferase [Acidimicrobiales bacterium]|jgi:putative flippase GtrA